MSADKKYKNKHYLFAGCELCICILSLINIYIRLIINE